ncbi:hypothetical protein CLF_101492 [Clonorchis sinensis]|uniref:Uncharacterized protein n=1 Tax=Clonorchis sinensis TaxID=79923 RepID=G7Y5V8_CLOSI|nr:hypothetical protein CLF_101492 [Clonorchis sinensis]
MSFGGDSANSFVMHGEKGPEDITRIDAKKDLGIWLSPNLSFSLHLEKSAQKAFAVLRMIRRTFSRITRTDFQILYGAYVRPLLEYANPVVYSGRTKDVILIERVQRAATKMVAGLKSMDYETRLVVLDLFPLEYRRLRGDLILTYALFEQGLANRFFTVDPAYTRRGHGLLGVDDTPGERGQPPRDGSDSSLDTLNECYVYLASCVDNLVGILKKRSDVGPIEHLEVHASDTGGGFSRSGGSVVDEVNALISKGGISFADLRNSSSQADMSLGLKGHTTVRLYCCTGCLCYKVWLFCVEDLGHLQDWKQLIRNELIRFLLRTSGDADAAATGYAGVCVVLRYRAEASLLAWTPVNSRNICVRKSRTPRFTIEKLVDPKVKRNYQNQLLERLPGCTMSDVNGHWGKISKALLKAGTSVFVMLQNVQSANLSLKIQGESLEIVEALLVSDGVNGFLTRLLSMGEISTSTGSSVDPEVLEIQKKLYKDQLIRQAIAKKGSKYYPVNIEPTPLERDRLALPFNDQDRALRKQWLDDLVLSEREPVAVPEWTRVNIFRRAYRKPFDIIADLVKPVIGPTSARYFRWTLHKFTLGLLAGWVIWYKAKYAPKGILMMAGTSVDVYKEAFANIAIGTMLLPAKHCLLRETVLVTLNFLTVVL